MFEFYFSFQINHKNCNWIKAKVFTMSYKVLCAMAGPWLFLSNLISYKFHLSAPTSLDFLQFLKYTKHILIRVFLLAGLYGKLTSVCFAPQLQLDLNYCLSYYPTLFFFTLPADIYAAVYLFYYVSLTRQ